MYFPERSRLDRRLLRLRGRRVIVDRCFLGWIKLMNPCPNFSKPYITIRVL
jgi:hypothetical protein